MLKSYLKNIFKIANQGDAREESYYSTLEALLKEAANTGNSGQSTVFRAFGKQGEMDKPVTEGRIYT